MSPLVAIAGPTASGKSALALALAGRTGAAILNFDSMQVWRELPILTAQPNAAERAHAPHHLYGHKRLGAPHSAARFRAEVVAELATLAGRPALLVGGTGLYLEALLRGFAPVPAVPPEIRAAARAETDADPEGAHRALAALDPALAARLAPRDRQRIARGLEVVRATGRALSSWQAEPPEGPPPGLTVTLLVVQPARAWLRDRIAARFAGMLAAGVREEVASVLTLPPAAQEAAARVIGFSALADHVSGAESLDATRDRVLAETAAYAKRQATWFRGRATRAVLGPALQACHALPTQENEPQGLPSSKILDLLPWTTQQPA